MLALLLKRLRPIAHLEYEGANQKTAWSVSKVQNWSFLRAESALPFRCSLVFLVYWPLSRLFDNEMSSKPKTIGKKVISPPRMNVFKTLKRIRFNQLVKLVGLSLKNMRFVLPTIMATKRCMAAATTHFGRQHYRNGPANAFRHALWNVLIAKYCKKVSSNTQKALNWTKTITDWHEETFFSKMLAMKMDVHNNQVGRMLYLANPLDAEAEFINRLIQLSKDACKIQAGTAMEPLKNQLVYITEDE